MYLDLLLRRLSKAERHLLHDSTTVTLKLQYYLKIAHLRLQGVYLAASIFEGDNQTPVTNVSGKIDVW